MTKDIYELLALVKRRPAMWLGKAEISAFKNFLDGFFYAQRSYDPHAFEWPPFELVQDWVELHLNRGPGSESWAGLLLTHYQGDEAAALQRFFELLDEFQQVRVVRGLQISLSPDNRAFYYSDDCKRPVYSATPLIEANRLPFPDQVYILQFSGLGYYAFQHRGRTSVSRAGGYRSLRAALKQLRLEFGPVLHQKFLADLSPAALAAIMLPASPDTA